MSIWTTKDIKGVTFSWFGGQLISITYNEGNTRTTFDPLDSNKFLNTTHESNGMAIEYNHLCGNEVAGICRVRDTDVIVLPGGGGEKGGGGVVVLNKSLKKYELKRKIQMYQAMLDFQLTTSVPEEIIKIWKENKFFNYEEVQRL